MTEQIRTFGLSTDDVDGQLPALRGVSVTGRLDGILFDWTLRQRYQNTGDQPLEVIYTFPLPDQSVLLGFASELNGQRMAGTVVPKKAAEQRYESALAEGDAPVMLEHLEGGLYTANIGNLNPGDELVVEVRLGQLLSYQGPRLRLAIPATIAPRYGSPEQAGLQAQQVPVISPVAEYPLSMSVTWGGGLAGAAVECPTHRFIQREVDGNVTLELATGAWLDRDVVILFNAPEAFPSRALLASDAVSNDAPKVVVAALQPPRRSVRRPVAIKALIDCSGSMAGDSMASARRALLGTLSGLGEQDCFSLSRFGSEVDHMTRPTACSPRFVRTLSELVGRIEADLGGTEMEAALRATFELDLPKPHAGADVLIITDGEVWEAKEVIRSARQSGHRIFAIGVGSSPAESLLRSMAESTGGACEFVTPGEALEAAAARMLDRIRQQPQTAVRIDWGTEPVWQTPAPLGVFEGDTVFAFAGLPAHANPTIVRLITTAAESNVVASCPVQTLSNNQQLPRMAAARRIADAGGSAHQGSGQALTERLAVDYQLITLQTNCILVHERAAADKSDQAAQMQRVSSMLAAGWGATSSLAALDRLICEDSGGLVLRNASVWSTKPRQTQPSVDFSLGSTGYDVDALPTPEQTTEAEPATLNEIAQEVGRYLSDKGSSRRLAAHCGTHKQHEILLFALEQLLSSIGPDNLWVVLAHWVNSHAQGLGNAALAALLQPHVARLDKQVLERCMAHLDQSLGAYDLDGWLDARAQRLKNALATVRQA